MVTTITPLRPVVVEGTFAYSEDRSDRSLLCPDEAQQQQSLANLNSISRQMHPGGLARGSCGTQIGQTTRTIPRQGVRAFSPAPAGRRGPIHPRNQPSPAIILLPLLLLIRLGIEEAAEPHAADWVAQTAAAGQAEAVRLPLPLTGGSSCCSPAGRRGMAAGMACQALLKCILLWPT